MKSFLPPTLYAPMIELTPLPLSTFPWGKPQDSLYIGIPKDIPASRLATLNNGFTEDFQAPAGNAGADSAGLFVSDLQQKAMMHSTSNMSLPTSESVGKQVGIASSDEHHGEEGVQPPQAKMQAVWARFKGREHLLNPTTFNMRQVREAVIPAANGHVSAEALARFYAGLVGSIGTEGGPLLTTETINQCIECALTEVRHFWQSQQATSQRRQGEDMEGRGL